MSGLPGKDLGEGYVGSAGRERGRAVAKGAPPAAQPRARSPEHTGEVSCRYRREACPPPEFSHAKLNGSTCIRNGVPNIPIMETTPEVVGFDADGNSDGESGGGPNIVDIYDARW